MRNRIFYYSVFLTGLYSLSAYSKNIDVVIDFDLEPSSPESIIDGFRLINVDPLLPGINSTVFIQSLGVDLDSPCDKKEYDEVLIVK